MTAVIHAPRATGSHSALTVTHCGVWGVGRVWVSRATGSWQSADATLHSHCRLLIVVIHHSTYNARDPQRGLSRATKVDLSVCCECVSRPRAPEPGSGTQPMR